MFLYREKKVENDKYRKTEVKKKGDCRKKEKEKRKIIWNEFFVCECKKKKVDNDEYRKTEGEKKERKESEERRKRKRWRK